MMVGVEGFFLRYYSKAFLPLICVDLWGKVVFFQFGKETLAGIFITPREKMNVFKLVQAAGEYSLSSQRLNGCER